MLPAAFALLVLLALQSDSGTVAGDTWTARASMSTTRNNHATAVVADEIYSIGGHSPVRLASVEKYHPASDTWVSVSAMPAARPTPVPTVTPSPIAVGGIVEIRTDPDVQRDQPASDSSLPLPASVAVGVLLLVAGGLYGVRMRRG